MAEEEILINSGGLNIEGLLENLPGDKGVVISHPHPLYGGNMHNNVVKAIRQAYRSNGYSTLRFNFRGVGSSEGVYDNGIGEQEDVRAALGHLCALGKNRIDLAGYSFGAWVNGLGLKSFDKVSRMVMVSPPVKFVDFAFLSYDWKIKLVIVGDLDEIADARAIEKALPTWNPEATLRVLEGADHFYGGRTDQLKSIISDFLSQE